MRCPAIPQSAAGSAIPPSAHRATTPACPSARFCACCKALSGLTPPLTTSPDASIGGPTRCARRRPPRLCRAEPRNCRSCYDISRFAVSFRRPVAPIFPPATSAPLPDRHPSSANLVRRGPLPRPSALPPPGPFPVHTWNYFPNPPPSSHSDNPTAASLTTMARDECIFFLVLGKRLRCDV
ncbi:hypothetical protein B0J12DRAFT_282542 [Macrophomina phaseolina]|uniref:Uncharacterized protein n=1 Tax=Macrophomina phaseolina TaxID=35725 RepID=A0ABQ8GMZ0_9PEZI|nr:hypothetical protein B0J12DRAFT_282542 [Macrophomina phaseolina]